MVGWKELKKILQRLFEYILITKIPNGEVWFEENVLKSVMKPGLVEMEYLTTGGWITD